MKDICQVQIKEACLACGIELDGTPYMVIHEPDGKRDCSHLAWLRKMQNLQAHFSTRYQHDRDSDIVKKRFERLSKQRNSSTTH